MVTTAILFLCTLVYSSCSLAQAFSRIREYCVANGGGAMTDKDKYGTTVTQYAVWSGSIEGLR